ncbi:ATP-binding protein, partial [Candidatus Bathyarchaeota archaeon]
PRPKTRREDLFNRDEELKFLSEALNYASIIAITGLRCTGKISFMKLALVESDCPYISLEKLS